MLEKAKPEREVWSGRIFLRYLLFQLPGWTLLVLILVLVKDWLNLSTPIMLGIIALWVTKDLVMFPFLWRAYDPNPERTSYRLVGERAVAQERFSPRGYVQVHGELWQAELTNPEAVVEKGQVVKIHEVRGLTLLVQPDN